MPIYMDLTLIKLQNAAAGLQSGGLAGTVVTDKSTNLPRRDMEAQIIDSGLFAVSFRQVFDFEHGIALSSH